MPCWSRTSPWALAARPSLRLTLRNLTSPVLASTRPTVTWRLGLLDVNQRLPSKSMPPSWVMRPSLEVVPRDQSVPSLVLRPHRVRAGGQRRKIVAALFVGVDAGRDRTAVGLGGDGHAAQPLARRRGDRAAEQMIGGLRGDAARNESSRGERDNAQLMGLHGVSPWPFNAWRWRALFLPNLRRQMANPAGLGQDLP